MPAKNEPYTADQKHAMKHFFARGFSKWENERDGVSLKRINKEGFVETVKVTRSGIVMRYKTYHPSVYEKQKLGKSQRN